MPKQVKENATKWYFRPARLARQNKRETRFELYQFFLECSAANNNENQTR